MSEIKMHEPAWLARGYGTAFLFLMQVHADHLAAVLRFWGVPDVRR